MRKERTVIPVQYPVLSSFPFVTPVSFTNQKTKEKMTVVVIGSQDCKKNCSRYKRYACNLERFCYSHM